MKCDIFLSICQTDVDGYMPTEKVMFQNFFDQVKLADQLGFGTAWVAETHLSCEIQKSSPQAVIPHFKGEIGLNTDILQMAHLIFSKTNHIEVGSAIRNILCNGGPIAHAEAIKTFLALHGLDEEEDRRLHIGFAAGRFDFSNRPYGVVARNEWERKAWQQVKNKAFMEATEIMLRLLKGEHISRADVPVYKIDRSDFRTDEEYQKVLELAKKETDDGDLTVKPFWNFEKVGVIPFHVRRELLTLTIGTHDPKAQELANKFMPVGVFNLSITPPAVIEETHQRFQKIYHKDGGVWTRDLMPRTCLIYVDENRSKAKEMAERAWNNYWKAMEGTIDTKKVEEAVSNTLAGDPMELVEMIKQKYNPSDRLMLWFDFNNHDNESVKYSMKLFWEKVRPKI